MSKHNEQKQMVKRLLPALKPTTEKAYAYQIYWVKEIGGTTVELPKWESGAKKRYRSTPIDVPVNHERRMRKLIEGCKTHDAMIDALAVYVRDNGRFSEEKRLITESGEEIHF